MKIIFSILSWGGIQLFYNILRNSDLKKWDEILKAVLFFLILVIISIVLPVSYGIQFDFPDMFLFSCISACPLAITGKVLIPFFRFHRCCTFQTLIFPLFSSLLYYSHARVYGYCGLDFYCQGDNRQDADCWEITWSEQELRSREFLWLNDLWHILSSFSLLMGSYLVLYIS